MQGFEITLEEHGMFLIRSQTPEDGDLKIAYDPEFRRRPWIVLEMDLATCQWYRMDSFPTLDEALNWAVSDVTGLARPNYKVKLPCGNHFSRPGRISAEDVLFSLGWTYVTHLVGFSPFNSDAPCSENQARKYFLDITQHSPTVEVGEVTSCDDGMERFWIADLRIPFDGFIRREDIEMETKLSFGAENIPLVEGYDCVIAVGGEIHTAEVMSLAEHVAARQMQAA